MVMTPLEQLIYPGVQPAVDRHIHDTDTDRFHQRISGVCPFCLTIGERLAKTFRENAPNSKLAELAREHISRLMDLQDEEAERQVSDGAK